MDDIHEARQARQRDPQGLGRTDDPHSIHRVIHSANSIK